jgi:hypothetical protein
MNGTDREPQRDRAIRRAAESVANVRRPADWTPADYRRFESVLRDNGYELVAKREEKSGG